MLQLETFDTKESALTVKDMFWGSPAPAGAAAASALALAAGPEMLALRLSIAREVESSSES